MNATHETKKRTTKRTLIGRVTATLAVALAVLAVGVSPASAREPGSISKDGCTITIAKPTAPSTWTRQVKMTVKCNARRTIQYGSISVMNDVPNRADTVEASAAAGTGLALTAGTTYTFTKTWSTGSTNGYGQYSRGVIKMTSWFAAAVVESGTVDGVSY